MLKSRYYDIGNVGKTASMSMLTLFESRYTLKGRYNIGNVGKTASMSNKQTKWHHSEIFQQILYLKRGLVVLSLCVVY